MKNQIVLLILIIFSFTMNAQDEIELNNEALKKALSENACFCIDSIAVYNNSSKEISKKIHVCIDEQVSSYQLVSQLSNLMIIEKDTSKQVLNKEININTNSESKEYKKYYYEIERYLMGNCDALKTKVKLNEKIKENSISNNPKAIEWYYKGIDESENNNFENSIKFYKKAIKIDPDFAFAWDNMGVAYRRLEEYKKAINAYEKSLKIDPKGKTPLQNIAVVYLYTEEYDKSLEAYGELAEIDKNNPETFYGIGLVNYQYKKDYEKGLQNMCKAYNLYIKEKSPYRTDAEKVINNIYAEMIKNGNETRFNEILKENNITIE